MEFKKCARCGAFYLSEDIVCFNCKPKDKAEIVKINNYIQTTSSISSIDEIALSTGISAKNVSRHLEGNSIISSFKKDNINNVNNISINL